MDTKVAVAGIIVSALLVIAALVVIIPNPATTNVQAVPLVTTANTTTASTSSDGMEGHHPDSSGTGSVVNLPDQVGGC